MKDKQLQAFLAAVRRTRFVDYLDPLGETAQGALERRLAWAKVSQGDPATAEEARFLLEHSDDLRDLLRRELDEDDWVEDTSAGREFGDGGARRGSAGGRLRENDRVTEIFQADDIRGGTTGVQPSAPRPQLAVRTPVPPPDRERVRPGAAAPVDQDAAGDDEDPDEIATGIMRLEDVKDVSLHNAIREASPRPVPVRAEKPAPASKKGPPAKRVPLTTPPPAAKAAPRNATSTDPVRPGAKAQPRPMVSKPSIPPPGDTPVPAALTTGRPRSRLATSEGSTPRTVEGARVSPATPTIGRPRGVGELPGRRVDLGTGPPAVPRIRPSEGRIEPEYRAPAVRVLPLAILGMVVAAVALFFAVPSLVAWFGRGEHIVLTEPVMPPLSAPAPAPPVVAAPTEAVPAPAADTVVAPPGAPVGPTPAVAVPPVPSSGTVFSEAAPRAPAPPAPAPSAPAVASNPAPAAPVAAPTPPVPDAVATAAPPPAPAAPAAPAFPLKGTWASSSVKLVVRSQDGIRFEGSAEVHQDDGSWTTVPVRGTVDSGGALTFDGGGASFAGNVKGGIATGNVIRGAGKDAEPVKMVRF